VTHHRAGLARLTRRSHPPEFVEAFVADWRGARVEPAEAALLEYAEKLTLTPGAMVSGDVDALRAVGWSDRAILEANLVVAYFAYANRITNGLGVTLEPEHRAADGA
jgi:uncharacterized peroxidase-related enzyme